jgi:hypothetical protein
MKKNNILFALLVSCALRAMEKSTKEQYLAQQNKNRKELVRSWNKPDQIAKQLCEQQRELQLRGESLKAQVKQEQDSIEQEFLTLNDIWEQKKGNNIITFIDESLNAINTPKPKRKNGSYRDGSESVDDHKIAFQVQALQLFIQKQNNLTKNEKHDLSTYILVNQQRISKVNIYSKDGTFSDDEEAIFLHRKPNSEKISRKKFASTEQLVDSPLKNLRKISRSRSFFTFFKRKK